jgi:hypothetical protein
MGHAQFKSIGMDKTIQMKGVMGGMNTWMLVKLPFLKQMGHARFKFSIKMD